MSSFSNNYKYIDLTNSYTITPLDPYYLYVNPKDISLSINLPSVSYPKGGGISYKIYNLSDKYSLSIITNTKSYLLSPKDSVEITTIDSDYIFNSEESNKLFTYDPVIGICRLAIGGITGKWCHVDRNGVPIVLPKNYFDNHPIYSNITPVVIDNQDMLRIPKFYVKYETVTSDNDPRGLPKGSSIKYISPDLLPEFHIHPGFMLKNKEYNEVFIALYPTGPLDSSSKLNSYKTTSSDNYLYSESGRTITFANWQTYANNRNVSGITGFILMTIYQWAAFQTLLLINKNIIKLTFIKCTFLEACYHLNKVLYIWDNTGTDFVNTKITMTCPDVNGSYFIRDLRNGTGSNFNLNDVFIARDITDDQNLGTYNTSRFTSYWYNQTTIKTHFFINVSNVLKNGFGSGFTNNLATPVSYSGRLGKY